MASLPASLDARLPSRLREVEALSRLHTQDAIEVLAEVMNSGDAPAAARVSAATALLDRGWGKSKQIVQLEDATQLMSDDSLGRSIASRLAQLAQRHGLTIEGELTPDADPADLDSRPAAIDLRDPDDPEDGDDEDED